MIHHAEKNEGRGRTAPAEAPGNRSSMPLAGCLMLMMARSLAAAPPAAISTQSGAIQRSLQCGTDWLLHQQSTDGGWHSRTYGKMKPGAGNTALVLETFSTIPEAIRPGLREASARGVAFLIRNRSSRGLVQLADDSTDYPVYATALLVSSLKQLPADVDPDLSRNLCQALLSEQRTTARGWSADRSDLGGWSPWQTSPAQADGEFPANISTTVWVLRALQTTAQLTPGAGKAASQFLNHCWSRESSAGGPAGFAFTPQADSPLNKLGWFTGPDSISQPRPYHSTTCDGICALLILKQSPTSDQLAEALNGLTKLPAPPLLTLPVEESASISPLSALYFYDTAAFAQIWRQTRDQRLADQRLTTIQTLLSSQKPDGSWGNPLPWYHEDDPLLATSLALKALSLLSE